MSKNYINVSVSTSKPTRVSVSTPANQQNVDVTRDTSAYNAEIAKQWATSENLVLNEDYSAKHYAKEAKKSEQNAESFESATRETYNSFVSDASSYIEELTELKDAGAVEINEAVASGKDEINSTKTTILNDIEFVADGEKKEIEELAENAKDDIKSTGFYMRDDKLYFINSKGEEEEFKSGGGGGLEIGDIGIAPLGIDESKGKRRYLNGQLIIQEQYVQFTNKVKSAVALYPSLACTESEWQTTATMTVGGQVGKFVVDDEAGTIRLPKIIMPIQGLTDLSKLGELVEAGLPNITGEIGSIFVGATTSGSGALSGWNTTKTKGGISNGSDNAWGVLNFDASRSNPIYSNSNTVQQEQIQYPYFIQVATGAETEDNIINEIELNNPYSFGDSKYSPKLLNNLSWLKSEGQYNPKAVYPAYYDWALTNFNNGVEGFALATGEYTDYDVVINPAEETFRLPLLDGSESLMSNKAVGLSVGESGSTYIAPANGWYYLRRVATASGQHATLTAQVASKGVATASGQYLQVFVPVRRGQTVEVSYTAPTNGVFRFIYAQGNGSLYFYVGETVQNANLINAGRIEEKLVDKVDINSKVIDGQWVCEQASLSTSTAVGTYTVDLSDYLPKDGYNYEVLFNIRVERTTTSGYSNIYTTTDLLDSSVANGNAIAIVGVDGRYMANTFVKPVGTKRYCQMIISSTAVTAMNFVALAYRRIGTNV